MENNGTPRQILFDTAVKLFSTKGYRETSIREISGEAGVNVSMISYYFGGKEGLLNEIIRYVTGIMESHIDRFDLENLDNLNHRFIEFLTSLEELRPHLKILFSEMGKDHGSLHSVKTKIGELQTALKGRINRSNGLPGNSSLDKRLQIMTDIILGMVFSDFIFDFSLFQDEIDQEDREVWRMERIQVLVSMLKQISGGDSGQLIFSSLFAD